MTDPKKPKEAMGETKLSLADTNKTISKLTDLVFVPTPLQQQIKSQFWTRFQPGPFFDPATLSLVQASKVVPDHRLSKWWTVEGFRAWFTNRDEVRERLEYLTHLALTAAENILLDPEAQASARVNLIKILLEATSRMPKTSGGGEKSNNFADSKINDMSEEELQKFLERQGVGLPGSSKREAE